MLCVPVAHACVCCGVRAHGDTNARVNARATAPNSARACKIRHGVLCCALLQRMLARYARVKRARTSTEVTCEEAEVTDIKRHREAHRLHELR